MARFAAQSIGALEGADFAGWVDACYALDFFDGHGLAFA
jgi:hypothetical protein